MCIPFNSILKEKNYEIEVRKGREKKYIYIEEVESIGKEIDIFVFTNDTKYVVVSYRRKITIIASSAPSRKFILRPFSLKALKLDISTAALSFYVRVSC